MTFTYSGDPAASARDAIRFYAQDTDADDQLLSDEEIDFIISNWQHVSDHPLFVAAVCCDSIAGRFAREISYSADGVSVGAEALQEKYTRLAASLRDQFKSNVVSAGPDVGGIMIGETYDASIAPLTWGKGMHDNIEAGQQDYGGTEPHNLIVPEIDGLP